MSDLSNDLLGDYDLDELGAPNPRLPFDRRVVDGYMHDGATADARDAARLGALLLRVRRYMIRHANEWCTKQELLAAAGSDDWATISARVRDLRKSKHGGFDIRRERLAGGAHRYMLAL